MQGLIEQTEFTALNKRGITEETCRKFGYSVGQFNGQPVQVAPFHDEHGHLVAQHLRFPNKDFIWLGEPKKAGLWGQHLWRDKGKRVIITEGEIDAMTISQLQGNKWPVVSVKSGAAGAHKDLAKAVEWLEQFEEVVMCLDMDKPGKDAVDKCSGVLSPGKMKSWNVPLKDANEMFMANREKEIIDAIWGAKVHRPDGIVSAADTWNLLMEEDAESQVPYPWGNINVKSHGLRLREIVTFCSGSGMGKSAIVREIAAHLMRIGQNVGYIALEESVKRSIRGFVGIELNLPIHFPEVRKAVPEEAMKAAFERVQSRAFFYDHFGSMDGDNLLNKIRFLVKGCDCKWIVLDHLSIVVSGVEGDERKLIDKIETNLRELVEELNIGLLQVVHLKRPEGKGHENGAETSLSQLRGSGGIAHISDLVWGAERNQQDELNSHITTMRILKNRYSGETGIGGYLSYDKTTGRLTETDNCPFEDETQEKKHDGSGTEHY
jgi:twinkle protein